MTTSTQAQPRLHYAWVVASVVFLILLCTAGVRATPEVLMVPLERELHWTRVTLSSAVSLNLVLYGLVGPFAAALMLRFGIRRTALISLTLIAAGVAATRYIGEVWQLVLLWGVLVGLGTGTTATVLGATVVQRWFVARRGTVMGVLTASSATGQLIFLPGMAALVESHGWRSVSTAATLVLLALIPLVAWLLRDQPADVGLLPYGATESTPPEAPRMNPFRSALQVLGRSAKVPDFRLLAGSFFVCGATTNGLVGTHLVPACMDHGIPEVRAAGLLATMGLFDLVGTTASGYLTDRSDSRRLLFWYYGLRGMALLALPTAFNWSLYGLPLFSILYGLDWIATVPPTVKLTAEVIGPADAPVAFGWIVASHQIGAALGALGAGAVRTAFATYTSAWVAAGALCLVAAVLVTRIGRRPAALVPTTELGAAA
jgi:predicted MFS family arabinose efflux permease